MSYTLLTHFVCRLEFTPLEFETRWTTALENLGMIELEFTPLEFETYITILYTSF